MKRILYAASEGLPFVKTGGLADVVGALPKAFPKEEFDVRVILPKYACRNRDYEAEGKLLLETTVTLGWRQQYAGIWEYRVDDIVYYLIDNEFYFGGYSLYSSIHLDAEKFAFFCRAVLSVLPEIGFCPDILHCHDWQTGLIPVYLDAEFRKKAFYRSMRTVFTIHNLKFQGRWYIENMKDVTGLPDEYFTATSLETYGSASLLKGGVVYADAVTTVSETYAGEVCTKDGGQGLDSVLQAHADKLFGICNGIDYDFFDPTKDDYIVYPLGSDITEFKRANKKALQQELSPALTVREDAFLVSMVSRLTDQKGMDLIMQSLPAILADERVQLLILGTGERSYEDGLEALARKNPGRVSVNLCYKEDLSHRVYAASDLFLMPSLFEPCGLSQMVAMHCGALPLVREVGGLKDTVQPFNRAEDTGTGFTFFDYSAQEFQRMFDYAKQVWTEDPLAWKRMQKRGMEQDFSWTPAVERYSAVYDFARGKNKTTPKPVIAKYKEVS